MVQQIYTDMHGNLITEPDVLNVLSQIRERHSSNPAMLAQVSRGGSNSLFTPSIDDPSVLELRGPSDDVPPDRGTEIRRTPSGVEQEYLDDPTSVDRATLVSRILSSLNPISSAQAQSTMPSNVSALNSVLPYDANVDRGPGIGRYIQRGIEGLLDLLPSDEDFGINPDEYTSVSELDLPGGQLPHQRVVRESRDAGDGDVVVTASRLPDPRAATPVSNRGLAKTSVEEGVRANDFLMGGSIGNFLNMPRVQRALHVMAQPEFGEGRFTEGGIGNIGIPYSRAKRALEEREISGAEAQAKVLAAQPKLGKFTDVMYKASTRATHAKNALNTIQELKRLVDAEVTGSLGSTIINAGTKLRSLVGLGGEKDPIAAAQAFKANLMRQMALAYGDTNINKTEFKKFIDKAIDVNGAFTRDPNILAELNMHMRELQQMMTVNANIVASQGYDMGALTGGNNWARNTWEPDTDEEEG